MAGAERGATRLAAEGLSALALSVRAIADESVYLRVGDVIIGTAAIGTGEALRLNPFRGAPATFNRGPGRHRRSGYLGAGRGRLLSADRAIVWGAWKRRR